MIEPRKHKKYPSKFRSVCYKINYELNFDDNRLHDIDAGFVNVENCWHNDPNYKTAQPQHGVEIKIAYYPFCRITIVNLQKFVFY